MTTADGLVDTLVCDQPDSTDIIVQLLASLSRLVIMCPVSVYCDRRYPRL